MLHRLKALRHVDWGPVIRCLRGSPRAVLTTHVRADTDGVGAEIALHRFLERSGMEVRILNPDALPAALRFLDPRGVVETYAEADAPFLDAATLVVLDVSDRERLGALRPRLRGRGKPIVCIDHHLRQASPGATPFETHGVIEPAAPSTGALLAELMDEMGAAIDAETAAALYATLVADTGSFRFSNTSGDVLRLAADLVDRGADPTFTHRAVFGNYSHPRVRLLAETLRDWNLAGEGRIAWYAVSRATLREHQAGDEDADGLIEYLRLAEGVQVAILFLELAAERVKVSFRSEDGIDVGSLAGRWGGGGHRHASGAVIAGPLDATVKRVVASAEHALSAPQGAGG